MSLQYQVLPNMTPEVIDEIKLQYPNLDLNTVQFVLSPDGQMNGQHLVIQEQMLNENEQMQVYQQSTGQHDGQQQIRITEQLQAPGTTQYYIQSDEINGEILNGIFYDQSQFHQVIDPQMIQQQQVFDTSTGSATTMQGDGIRQHQQQTQQIVIQHVQQSSEQPMIQVQSEQQQILVQQQQHQQQQQQQQQTLIQAQHYQQIHNQQQLHQIQQQSKQQQVVIHQQQQPQAQQQHQSSIPQQAATHQIIYETPKTHAVLASNQQIVQRAATTVTNRGRGGRGRGAVGGQGIVTSASTFSAPRTQRPQFVRAPKPRAQKVNTTATATLIPRPRNPSVLSSQVNQNVDRFIPKLNDMPSQQIPQQSQQMPQQSQQQQSQTIQQQTTSTPIVKRTLPVTVTKRMVPLVVAKTAQSQQTSIVHSSFANAVSGDFEDSITAAKIAKQINTQRTVSIDSNSSGSSSVNNSSQSFGNNDHHHLLTATESPEDNHKVVTLTNGNTMTLAEYKRLRASQMPQFIPNNMAALRGGLVAPRGARGGRVLPTFVRKPVPQQQPQIYQTQLEVQQQHQSQQQQQHQQQQQQQHQHQTLISNNNASSLNIVSKAEQQNSAKMLVILKSGEQRLITFTLPKESCTVQELLEQVQVPFTNDTNILCYETPNSEINYTVTVGLTKEEADLQVYPKDRQQVKVEDSQKECALKQQQQRVMQVQQTLPHQQQRLSTIPVGLTAAQALQNQSIMASNIKKTVLNTINQELKEMPLPPMKRVEGMLAVCCGCGYTSVDHAKCERCKRIFTEAPKQIPLHAKLPALIATSSGTSSAPSTPAQSTSADNVDVRRRTIATDLLKTWNRKPAVVAAQLAGKSRVRKAKILEDPIVLTLSSDDESEPTKPKKIAKSLGNSDSHFEPFSFEPVIPKEDDTDLNLSRENVAETADDTLFTVVSCRTVRIGSFKFEPKHKVVFSSKGIRITAPSVKCSTDNVVLDIQTRELIKIVAHFPRSLCVLFIYTLPSCAQYIRDQLEMGSQHDPAGYFSSTSTDETQRRICLVLDGIADEARSVIKSIFPSTVLEEISQKDANDLLLRSSRDHAALAIGKKNACSSSSQIDYARSSNKEDDDEIRQVLIYPQGKGGISINTEDYACLAIDQYLNDVIIDFYLNYLLLEILTPDQRDKAHVFSSFFYKRLTTITTRQRNDKDPAASKMTASQKRHARVKNWTKNVNLFEKEFIIIPINEQSHWFLAIICFPGLKGPVTFDGNIPVKPEPIHKKKAHDSNKMTVPSLIGNTTITPVASRRELDAVFLQDDCSDRDEAEGDDSELGSDESDSEPTQPTPPKSQSKLPKEPRQPIKQPCILIFDSLAGASRSRVVATLRDYLTCEYRAKIATQTTSHAFNKLNLPGHCVKVPQQNNFTDCGLYLLQYVEHFFESPILDYRLPIKQLVNWFETIIVTRKREEISLLLHALVQKYDPANLPLPELALPTKDGELLERDDEDDDEDMDEAEFEEQSLDNYQFIKSETEKDSPDSSPDKQNNGRKKVLKRLLIKRESIGVKLNKNSNAAGDCGGESEKKRKQVETDGDEQTQRPVKKQAKSNTS